MTPEPSKKILVISDTHFGEGDAMLASRERVDRLIEWLEAQGDFQEIVLLGDIWELWTASFQEATAESHYLLERLAALPAGRIVYLPGNHDHHLLVQHQLVEQIQALRDDRALEVPAHTQREFEDSHLSRLLPVSARARFLVSYPDYFTTIGEHPLVFHHGHHTSLLHSGPSLFSSAPRFILQRLEEVGLHDMRRSDLELASTIFFEAMYAASLGRQTRRKMNAAWDRLLTFREHVTWLVGLMLRPLQRWVLSRERGTPEQEVNRYAPAATRSLALAEGELERPILCDGYFFGHTHRAGIGHSVDVRGAPMILANAGTWLHEPSKRNDSSEGTFLLISAEGVFLYRQWPDLSIRELDRERWPERDGGDEAAA